MITADIIIVQSIKYLTTEAIYTEVPSGNIHSAVFISALWRLRLFPKTILDNNNTLSHVYIKYMIYYIFLILYKWPLCQWPEGWYRVSINSSWTRLSERIGRYTGEPRLDWGVEAQVPEPALLFAIVLPRLLSECKVLWKKVFERGITKWPAPTDYRLFVRSPVFPAKIPRPPRTAIRLFPAAPRKGFSCPSLDRYCCTYHHFYLRK